MNGLRYISEIQPRRCDHVDGKPSRVARPREDRDAQGRGPAGTRRRANAALRTHGSRTASAVARDATRHACIARSYVEVRAAGSSIVNRSTWP